ncbi:MAG TPA: hypothetical protein VFV05_11895 [Methylomirabilota bacterium]|nr:hypothetical protein [Methylomirabilota bacterium]
MKRSLIALAILALSAGTAVAAPGDPRVVQGTLEWPASLAAEPFIAMRGEDGRVYYVDVSAAQRRVPGALTAGSRVAVLGVEGTRPHEMAALVLGAGDAASLGLTAPNAAPAPGGAAEPVWRLDGTVQSVSGSTITLRTADGKTHNVEASQLSDATLRALHSGDRVSLFGVPQPDRRLVANGYIQVADPPPPAASPR